MCSAPHTELQAPEEMANNAEGPADDAAKDDGKKKKKKAVMSLAEFHQNTAGPVRHPGSAKVWKRGAIVPRAHKSSVQHLKMYTVDTPPSARKCIQSFLRCLVSSG